MRIFLAEAFSPGLPLPQWLFFPPWPALGASADQSGVFPSVSTLIRKHSFLPEPAPGAWAALICDLCYRPPAPGGLVKGGAYFLAEAFSPGLSAAPVVIIPALARPRGVGGSVRDVFPPVSTLIRRYSFPPWPALGASVAFICDLRSRPPAPGVFNGILNRGTIQSSKVVL